MVKNGWHLVDGKQHFVTQKLNSACWKFVFDEVVELSETPDKLHKICKRCLKLAEKHNALQKYMVESPVKQRAFLVIDPTRSYFIR